MNIHTRLTFAAALLTLSACATTPDPGAGWSHASLPGQPRQQAIDTCMATGKEAKDAYWRDERSKLSESSGWVGPWARLRKGGLQARDAAFDACMQAAGFTQP